MTTFFDLSGKRAVVTGGSSGIGLAVARRFLDAGAAVAVADVNATEELDGSGAFFVEADVSDPSSVEHAFAAAAGRMDGLDIVVNNAGIAPETGPTQATLIDAARRTIEVNLNGVMWGLRHAPAFMRDGGSIINTASAAATVGFPTYGPYAASKAGVEGLTRAAAVDLGPLGIRVNAVCPGTVLTAMQSAEDLEANFTRLASLLGRTGETDDVVGVYHFLASDESRWLTGQAIYVDGGLSAGFSRQLVQSRQD